MKIDQNTVVSVTYDLHAGEPQKEKTFVETADINTPLEFLFGTGGLIEAFENNLSGLTIGDKFEFDIPANQAYGNIDPEAVVNLPKDIFMNNGKLEDIIVPGAIVPMTDEEGHRLNGKVLEVKDSEVIMDFNHPLAGKDLHFKGEVVQVRAASAEEIDHGHVHNGHHHH